MWPTRVRGRCGCLCAPRPYMATQACNMRDQRRMEALGAAAGIPLAADAGKLRHDTGRGAVRSAGRALANPKVRMRACMHASTEACWPALCALYAAWLTKHAHAHGWMRAR